MSHKLKTARSPERSEGHNSHEVQSHTVRVQARSVYGVHRIYPKNLAARSFCALTGRKTLMNSDLLHIEDLGFTIEWIPETAGEVPDAED
jgi:hypothetical protein